MAQQVVFRNLIFDAEVVEQRLRAGVLPIISSQPPRMAIACSITNSRLLITLLLSPWQAPTQSLFQHQRDISTVMGTSDPLLAFKHWLILGRRTLVVSLSVSHAAKVGRDSYPLSTHPA